MKNIFSSRFQRHFRPRILLLAAGLTGTLLVGSCGKDFLTIAPQGAITDAIFPTTEQDALLAVNGTYSAMRNWNIYSGGMPVLDIMSDDAYKGSSAGDAGRLNLFDNFTFSATASDIFPWYAALYLGVKRANTVIEKVPPITMDEALKTRYIAEARFFRAYFYFNLVRAFGDVPKVMAVIPERKLGRSPKQEIYAEIILPDLQFAVENLPSKAKYGTNNVGRITSGAAKAFLAKASLYLKDYATAEKYALEVINSGEYALEPDFGAVFSQAGQFGPESVFEIGALPFESDGLGGNQYANTQGVRGIPNRGWGFNRPSLSLIGAFGAGDKRKDATIIFLGEILDGVAIQGDKSTNDTVFTDATKTQIKELETYNQKVWTPGSTTIEQWGYNIRIMRYAEVLLIAAEALNENGKGANALTHLNAVRQRAGVADFTDGNQATLRQAIWDERHLELALEGDRFFDLVRTGQAPTVLGPLGFVTGKHELFPIPQSEIDLSEGLLKQNPNW